MAKYDIYIAKVYYSEDDPHYEYKPVLQIKEDPNKPNSFAVITHHKRRKHYHGEIEIENWEECGLNKLSTIRLTQRLDNPKKSKKYIGTLKGPAKKEVFLNLNEKHFIQRHKTEDLDDDFDMKLSLLEA